jgi:ornithine decarboxylase
MPKDQPTFRSVVDVASTLSPSYPVYCLRPHILERNARRFMTTFPGTVLYAVKCNPHPLVLRALYQAGIRHFDTASLPEIALVSESFPDAHAYFMHPVKGRAVIRSAYTVYGVRHFVVDHPDELAKVLRETDREGLVIVVRIATPPVEGTLYHLAAKFGATPEVAAELAKEAAKQRCKVGFCFHVGSQCLRPEAYRSALEMVGEVIERSGIEPVLVDVGGGFPAHYADTDPPPPPLDAYMGEIRAGVKAIRLQPDIDLWCEPGRALVASACSLLTQVQLRKDDRLYINDGIYGSLSETVQAKIELPARLVRLDGPVANAMQGYLLNGPTCDSLDVLPTRYQLPTDTREGDWVEIDQIGAYSNANATHFNGFHPETYVTLADDPPATFPRTGRTIARSRA